MADVLQIVKSPHFNEKLMKFGTQQHTQELDDSQMTNMNIFKIQDRTAAILKSYFNHNSAADCPISV